MQQYDSIAASGVKPDCSQRSAHVNMTARGALLGQSRHAEVTQVDLPVMTTLDLSAFKASHTPAPRQGSSASRTRTYSGSQRDRCGTIWQRLRSWLTGPGNAGRSSSQRTVSNIVPLLASSSSRVASSSVAPMLLTSSNTRASPNSKHAANKWAQEILSPSYSGQTNFLQGSRVNYQVQALAGQLGWWHLISRPVKLVDYMLPVIQPTSRSALSWHALMGCVMVYVAGMYPLGAGYARIRDSVAMLVSSYVVTVLFTLDILFWCRAAYITDRGQIVRDTHAIVRTYTLSWLWIDVLSAAPILQLLYAFDGVDGAWAALLWLPLLKLLRLSRLRVPALEWGRHANLYFMARLVLFIVVVAHWAGCAWHFLTEMVPEYPWTLIDCQRELLAAQYLCGLYSALLLMLGDRAQAGNNLERIFVVLMLFAGTCLYAIVVGNMAMLVANYNATASRNRQRARMVKDTLSYQGVPPSQQAAVSEYFDHLTMFAHPGSDGMAFMTELPQGLFRATMTDLFLPTLSQVALFRSCDAAFMADLAQRLRMVLYTAGEIVYRPDDVGHDMYVIWQGAVLVTNPMREASSLLTAGMHFGQSALAVVHAAAHGSAHPQLRGSYAVCLRPSDLLLLSVRDLVMVMRDYPESGAIIQLRAGMEADSGYGGPSWTLFIEEQMQSWHQDHWDMQQRITAREAIRSAHLRAGPRRRPATLEEVEARSGRTMNSHRPRMPPLATSVLQGVSAHESSMEGVIVHAAAAAMLDVQLAISAVQLHGECEGSHGIQPSPSSSSCSSRSSSNSVHSTLTVGSVSPREHACIHAAVGEKLRSSTKQSPLQLPGLVHSTHSTASGMQCKADSAGGRPSSAGGDDVLGAPAKLSPRSLPPLPIGATSAHLLAAGITGIAQLANPVPPGFCPAPSPMRMLSQRVSFAARLLADGQPMGHGSIQMQQQQAHEGGPTRQPTNAGSEEAQTNEASPVRATALPAGEPLINTMPQPRSPGQSHAGPVAESVEPTDACTAEPVHGGMPMQPAAAGIIPLPACCPAGGSGQARGGPKNDRQATACQVHSAEVGAAPCHSCSTAPLGPSPAHSSTHIGVKSALRSVLSSLLPGASSGSRGENFAQAAAGVGTLPDMVPIAQPDDPRVTTESWPCTADPLMRMQPVATRIAGEASMSLGRLVRAACMASHAGSGSGSICTAGAGMPAAKSRQVSVLGGLLGSNPGSINGFAVGGIICMGANPHALHLDPSGAGSDLPCRHDSTLQHSSNDHADSTAESACRVLGGDLSVVESHASSPGQGPSRMASRGVMFRTSSQRHDDHGSRLKGTSNHQSFSSSRKSSVSSRCNGFPASGLEDGGSGDEEDEEAFIARDDGEGLSFVSPVSRAGAGNARAMIGSAFSGKHAARSLPRQSQEDMHGRGHRTGSSRTGSSRNGSSSGSTSEHASRLGLQTSRPVIKPAKQWPKPQRLKSLWVDDVLPKDLSTVEQELDAFGQPVLNSPHDPRVIRKMSRQNTVASRRVDVVMHERGQLQNRVSCEQHRTLAPAAAPAPAQQQEASHVHQGQSCSGTPQQRDLSPEHARVPAHASCASGAASRARSALKSATRKANYTAQLARSLRQYSGASTAAPLTLPAGGLSGSSFSSQADAWQADTATKVRVGEWLGRAPPPACILAAEAGAVGIPPWERMRADAYADGKPQRTGLTHPGLMKLPSSRGFPHGCVGVGASPALSCPATVATTAAHVTNPRLASMQGGTTASGLVWERSMSYLHLLEHVPGVASGGDAWNDDMLDVRQPMFPPDLRPVTRDHSALHLVPRQASAMLLAAQPCVGPPKPGSITPSASGYMHIPGQASTYTSHSGCYSLGQGQASLPQPQAAVSYGTHMTHGSQQGVQGGLYSMSGLACTLGDGQELYGLACPACRNLVSNLRRQIAVLQAMMTQPLTMPAVQTAVQEVLSQQRHEMEGYMGKVLNKLGMHANSVLGQMDSLLSRVDALETQAARVEALHAHPQDIFGSALYIAPTTHTTHPSTSCSYSHSYSKSLSQGSHTIISSTRPSMPVMGPVAGVGPAVGPVSSQHPVSVLQNRQGMAAMRGPPAWSASQSIRSMMLMAQPAMATPQPQTVYVAGTLPAAGACASMVGIRTAGVGVPGLESTQSQEPGLCQGRPASSSSSSSSSTPARVPNNISNVQARAGLTMEAPVGLGESTHVAVHAGRTAGSDVDVCDASACMQAGDVTMATPLVHPAGPSLTQGMSSIMHRAGSLTHRALLPRQLDGGSSNDSSAVHSTGYGGYQHRQGSGLSLAAAVSAIASEHAAYSTAGSSGSGLQQGSSGNAAPSKPSSMLSPQLDAAVAAVGIDARLGSSRAPAPTPHVTHELDHAAASRPRNPPRQPQLVHSQQQQEQQSHVEVEEFGADSSSGSEGEGDAENGGDCDHARITARVARLRQRQGSRRYG